MWDARMHGRERGDAYFSKVWDNLEGKLKVNGDLPELCSSSPALLLIQTRELEYLDINLTKDSSLLLHAIFCHLYTIHRLNMRLDL
jgi:hypothetical protein